MRPRLTLSLLALIVIATSIDYRLQEIIVHDSCEVLWYSEPMLNQQLTDCTLNVETNPGDANSHFEMGNAWMNRAEADRAIASYDRAIELDPTMAIACKNRGLAWRAKGFDNKALVDLEHSVEMWSSQIRSSPDDADAYYQRGLVYQELGSDKHAQKDLTKAQAICTAEISANPRAAATYVLRGKIAQSRRDFGQAVVDFQHSVELAPAIAEYRIELGLALCEQQNFEQALAEFDRAIEIAPREARYYRLRGRVWKEYGIRQLTQHDPESVKLTSPVTIADDQPGRREYESAIGDYSEAINRDMNDWMAYCDRAETYVLLGQLDAAIDDYARSTCMAPQDFKLRIQLAVALAKKQKNLSAIRNLRVAIQLKPNHADTYFLRAQLLFETGDMANAIYHLEQAMELDPDQAPYYQKKMKSWQVRTNTPTRENSDHETQQSQFRYNTVPVKVES